MTHFAPFDGTYVYFRHNEDTDTQLMVVINKGDTQELNLRRFAERLSDGSRIRRVDVTGAKQVALGDDLSIPAHQASVWLINE